MIKIKLIKLIKNEDMRYVLVLFLFVFSGIYANVTQKNSVDKLVVNKPKIQIEEVKFQGGFDKFIKKFRLKESSNNPDTVNGCGMLGYYGFGMRARLECGYGHITVEEFKNNPKIWPEKEQDKAFVRYLKINKRRISSIIKKYNNKVVGGIRITESGLLAACHLAGSGNVEKYFETNGEFVFADSNETSVKDYLKEFGGFKFNLSKL